ncbi:LuxR C-terminal-related transcriptional regulator [Embleya hyalina]|uniref:LuxR family transcriptional regulator n=1 Tax=Embleya hyalina TaxID=516124 RepID=A0A401YQP8_9ACTN|nr:LuxR C-terminal-related transcriptional regulator [Embleya hyalina]GCD96911.1 LuxR family transcriptional regulator [Embleya hyalina]
MVGSADSAAKVPWPVILTSFVGREGELGELRALLRRDRRLLTLVGPGGIGKTRLALRLASHEVGQPPADVVFVDLGALGQEHLVDAAVSDAVAPEAGPGHTPLRTAARRLCERSALVVLDTCEHLPFAAARVARTLIERCPDVRVVATSRIPLRTDGERVWRVPPLAVGDRYSPGPSEAARLFVDRVSLVCGDLDFSESMWSEVEHIVRALDGFPLAIELAAARTRMMTLGEIAAGLDLRFLSGGPARGQPRHQTMHRCLDWSYALLSGREKMLFARLSVFAEGWTAEAAAEVCAGGELTAERVLASLTALVDKSLVVRFAVSSGDRFRMLSPMRQYAAALPMGFPESGGPTGSVGSVESVGSTESASPGGPVDTAARHLAYFVRFAERADAGLWALRPRERRLLEVEMPNLRAALDEGCRLGSTDALRITAALGSYWRARGSLAEGVEATARALAAVPSVPHPARAMTLAVRATLSFWMGDLETTRAAATEAIEVAKVVRDKRARSHALLRLANFTAITDPPLGQPILREAVELARACDDVPALADALGSLAMTLLWQDDFAAMARTAEEALAVAVPVDFQSVRSLTLWCLAHGARARGDLDEAVRLARAMTPPEDDAADSDGDGEAGSFTRSCRIQVLSLVAAMRGDAAGARALALADLARLEQEPMRWGTGLLTYALAFAALAAGRLDEARDLARRLDAGESGGSSHLAAQAHSILMFAALADGDAAAARAHAADVVGVADRLGNHRALAIATLGEARAALLVPDAGSAEPAALKVLAHALDEGWWPEAVTALEFTAAAAVERGEHARATRLFAAVDTARRTRGMVRVPAETTYWEALRATAGEGLSEPDRRRALAEGAAMSLSQAADHARTTHNPRARATRGWESLTPTETRVALLAADGLLNPEIAEQLFVSRGTVKIHLSHIYTKLSLTNRTELAAYIHARRPHT